MEVRVRTDEERRAARAASSKRSRARAGDAETDEDQRVAKAASSRRSRARARGEEVPLLNMRPVVSREEYLQQHRAANRSWAARNPANALLIRTRTNLHTRGTSRAKNIEFDLTLEWMKEHMAAGCCERSGIPFSDERGSPWRPSIDRVDSDGGYTPDNCQVVCWIYNRAKGNGPDADVLRLARALAARTPEEEES